MDCFISTAPQASLVERDSGGGSVGEEYSLQGMTPDRVNAGLQRVPKMAKRVARPQPLESRIYAVYRWSTGFRELRFSEAV